MVADAPVLGAGDAGGALRVLYYVKGFPPCETGGPAEGAYHLVREWLRGPRVRLTLVVQTDSPAEEIRTSLGAGDRLTVVRLPYFPHPPEPTALRRAVTEAAAVAPARIAVTPLGVDVSGAPAMPPLGGVGLPRILFVGKLEEIKGPDLLFAALERLRSGGTIVEVTLVGTGSLE